MTREGVFFQRCLHHPAQAGKPPPQIRHSCGDPDARSCRQSDHASKHSIAVRSTTASTVPATRTVPLANLISTDPMDAFNGRGGGPFFPSISAIPSTEEGVRLQVAEK